MQRHKSQTGRGADGAEVVDDEVLGLSDFAVTARFADVPWADVALATHRPTGRACVLFTWRASVHRDGRLARRVARDGDAARTLRHPGVAQVQGRGTLPDGRWFLAFEYVAGPSIADVLDADGRLTPKRFIRLARVAADALAAAHAAGVYHGYLTPDNLILTSSSEDGRSEVTVSGFGTAAGRAGTLGGFLPPAADRPYLSPERVAGAAPGVRSDLFSLASLLQLALDGSPPLAVRAGAGAAVSGRPSDDEDGDTALWHRTVSGVLARARAAEPQRRHASVAAFRDELLAVVAAYGDTALAAPGLHLLEYAEAAEAAALADGAANDPEAWDRAETPHAPKPLYSGPLTGRWAEPEPFEPSRDHAATVDSVPAPALRPEMEIAVLAPPGAPPHAGRAGSAPPGGTPAEFPHEGPAYGRSPGNRRRQRIRATATVVGAGVLAFAAGFVGRDLAEPRPAPPAARGRLVDLSVSPAAGRNRPASLSAVPTPPGPARGRARTAVPDTPAMRPPAPPRATEREDRPLDDRLPTRAQSRRATSTP